MPSVRVAPPHAPDMPSVRVAPPHAPDMPGVRVAPPHAPDMSGVRVAPPHAPDMMPSVRSRPRQHVARGHHPQAWRQVLLGDAHN